MGGCRYYVVYKTHTQNKTAVQAHTCWSYGIVMKFYSAVEFQCAEQKLMYTVGKKLVYKA